MRYRWLLSTVRYGPGQMYGRLSVTAARCLWYDTGAAKLRRIVSDASPKGRSVPYWNVSAAQWAKKNGGRASWGKDAQFTARMIEALAPPGGVVLDPFSGGGTVPAACVGLGRRYLAFEIDSEAAAMARDRVANTQDPLPLAIPQQMTIQLPKGDIQ